MVLGGETFGRCLGHKSRALKSGINATGKSKHIV